MKSKDRFYRAVISGERLMMHNEQLANPFNPYTQDLRKVSSKRKKTIEDHEEMARIEFQGGLYHDEKLGPYVPGHAIHKMITEGARRRKLGKEIEQKVLMTRDMYPLHYDGPRDRKGLWAAKDNRGMPIHVDQRLVGIGQKRILRTRPLFLEWELPFELRVIDGDVEQTDIGLALEAAQLIGLLDGRPQYAGQFTLKLLKEIEERDIESAAA